MKLVWPEKNKKQKTNSAFLKIKTLNNYSTTILEVWGGIV